MFDTLEATAYSILEHYPIAHPKIVPISIGNVNKTFNVHAAQGQYILQRVNPIFSPEVHHDIDAVTRHLHHAGFVTPLLLRTQQQELWHRDIEGGIWRLQTFIDGSVYNSAEEPSLCFAAAILVGQFHQSVSQLEHEFQNVRPHVHDTPRHLANLSKALQTHPHHRAFGEVEPVATAILEMAARLTPLPSTPRRIVHGDLKINNIIFGNHNARALIDLDTLSHMTVPLEMGDALRSWCNPLGENAAEGSFRLPWFEAALQGYRQHAQNFLTQDEILAIPLATQTIAMELASRFAADALQESYFGWDATRFPSATAHHLLRARGQLALAQSIAKQYSALEKIVRSSFGI